MEGLHLHHNQTHRGEACHLALGGVCDRLLYPLRQPGMLDRLHLINDACKVPGIPMNSLSGPPSWTNPLSDWLGFWQGAPPAFNLRHCEVLPAAGRQVRCLLDCQLLGGVLCLWPERRLSAVTVAEQGWECASVVDHEGAWLALAAYHQDKPVKTYRKDVCKAR